MTPSSAATARELTGRMVLLWLVGFFGSSSPSTA